MQPESTSLGDLFCRRIPFKVPKYQRAFDWEQEEIDDFIKDLLVLYNARKINPSQPRKHFFGGLVSIKQHIPNSYTGNLYDLVDGQQRLFIEISERRWPYRDATASDWQQERLQRLIKVLRHTLCIPLLLSVYNCLSEKEFIEIINILERFAFRYITIVGGHAEKISTIYYDHAKLIRQAPQEYKIPTLRNELKTVQEKYASDEAFESLLIQKLSYQDNSSKKIIIRHFLTTLEDHIEWYSNGANGRPKPNEISIFDLSKVTIEHIYPQNASSTSQIEELELLKNDIGNLSFWPGRNNTSAGNRSFSEKKTLYEQSNVTLNRELAKFMDWDKQNFQQRRNKLLKIAKKIFTV
ncbi:MAG: DUF262 domain-containing protein [Nostoc sp.]|uniref:DUF262 domain-containing HNH endonuclease family protein n=1 Tax=Nostoc sp. TaxID=1180 RepID=UPI002FF81DCE